MQNWKYCKGQTKPRGIFLMQKITVKQGRDRYCRWESEYSGPCFSESRTLLAPVHFSLRGFNENMVKYNIWAASHPRLDYNKTFTCRDGMKGCNHLQILPQEECLYSRDGGESLRFLFSEYEKCKGTDHILLLWWSLCWNLYIITLYFDYSFV